VKRTRFCFAVFAALGAGCSEGDGPDSPSPASVDVWAGANQVAEAGSPLPLPLAVIVRTPGGSPLSGVTVTWAIISGGGGVSPTTSVTGANGTASTERILGPNAGEQRVTATVAGLTPLTFTAIAQIQGAVQMGSRSIGPLTDTVLGTLTEFEQPLKVLVLDHLGVPVPGVIVTWTASGGGSVSSPSKATDAGGESIVEYTFGAEARDGYGATASVPGLIGSPVTFEMRAHPATPVALVKTGGDGLVVQAGGQVGHTVNARDSYGNGTQGVAIGWAVAIGGGSVNPANNFTGNGGHAEATRTLGSGIGEQTTTATAAALPGAPVVTFTTLAAEAVVRVANNAFLPGAVTIQAGDSVAWQWQGNTLPHNITFGATPGAPASEPDRTSGVVWRLFPTQGTFAYQCTNHAGMNGMVTVDP
jgi:plastocyanin